MKKSLQRVYIDTSVVGGYFDKEFSGDSIEFFKRVSKGEIVIVVSSLLEVELIGAPEKVRQLIGDFPERQVERVWLTEEAMQIADRYVKAKVVGKTSIEDCRHIALATVCKVDVLVSWNFKHIVNVERINGYNSVNLKHGFGRLDIRTPKEVLRYED